MNDWQLAFTTSIRYVDFMGRRTLGAAVRLPNTCYEARITRSPLDIWPPIFLVQSRKKPDSSTFCPMLMGTAWVSIDVPHGPDEITVVDAAGRHKVPVEIVKAMPKDQPHSMYALKSDAAASLPKPRTALGYSNSWSIEEAIRDAINTLATTPQYPDELLTYSVDHIGAELGGIVGFNRLVVQVSESRITIGPVKP